MNSSSSRLGNPARYAISITILGVATAVGVAMYLLKKEPEERDVVHSTQSVALVAVEPFEGTLEIRVSGIVEPHREVKIAAQVSGRVTEKTEMARAGNFVRAGQPLLTIDARDYELEIKRLEAELAQSRAAIRELEDELAGMELSRAIVEKDFRLQGDELKRREAIGSALSRTELDQARRGVVAAERSLTDVTNSITLAKTRKVRLESGIDLSLAMLEMAQLNLERTTLTAPFDGVIVRDLVEQGDYVRTGDELVTLEDTALADVKCSLRVDQVQRILKYQIPDSRFDADPITAAYQLPPTPVTITAEASGATVIWEGILKRFDGIGVDEQTRMIPCRVVVDEPVSLTAGRPVALVRNMFVDVVIGLTPMGNTDETLLTLPEIAIHPGGIVWSVVDNRLLRNKVTVLGRHGSSHDESERTVVVRAHGSGLTSESKVVVTPLAHPHPGVEVRLLTDSSSGEGAGVGGGATTGEERSTEPLTQQSESSGNPASARAEEGNANRS